MKELDELSDKLKKFHEERDWEQFHSPKNVAMALSVEASEIVEIFQWMREEQSYELSLEKEEELKEELADVFLYLQLLASKFDIDLLEEAGKKLEKNQDKYPVDKSKGSSKKYTEL